jgi:hypothetical protein
MGGSVNQSPPRSTVIRYSFNDDNFEAVPELELPGPRFAFGSAVHQGLFYIVGGYISGNLVATDTVFKIDPQAPQGGWQTLASLPTPRAYSVCVVVNGKLYSVGGLQTFAGLPSAAIL